jgi:GNAT superfamily N-acetyltransferase
MLLRWQLAVTLSHRENKAMIEIRRAREIDAEAIREMFHLAYGDDYFYPQYYDVQSLKRMILSDDTLFLVAEETDTGAILGTASVLLEIGAHADLVAEFGRLVVHPEGRGQGIGGKLMQARVEFVQDRLHVGMVENRSAHEFSQRISHQHGFHPVGLLPDKFKLGERESAALYVRHFGQALELRRNHPQLIPEIYPLAKLALENCLLTCDAIIEAEPRAYPHVEQFQIQEMESELYPVLLRFERGRIKQREIFGRMRLHYGLFQLRASHAQYLLAYRDEIMVGAIGFSVDEHERTGKVFELVSLDDTPIYYLVSELVTRCKAEGRIDYLEADVNAYSPQMQQTFLENGFLPAAYIPAMVFNNVERLDVVRMVNLLTPWDGASLQVYEAGRSVATLVDESLSLKNVLPQLIQIVKKAPLFAGLSEEQQQYVAASAELESLEAGAVLFRPDDPADKIRVIISGEIEIQNCHSHTVGTIGPDESLGDLASITEQPHRVLARVKVQGQAMLYSREALVKLIHTRPDIGIILYRNFCRELAEKLQRMNVHTLFRQD